MTRKSRNLIYLTVSVMVIWAVMNACANLTGISETPTPEPTNTPEPTETAEPTSTPRPTETPVPTSTKTSTPEASLLMDERRVVEGWDYSFQPIVDFDLQINDGQVLMGSPDDEVMITMAKTTHEESVIPLETVMDRFIAEITPDIEDFERGEYDPIIIDEKEGLAVDISGILFEEKITGRIAVVEINTGEHFFVFAIAVDGPQEEQWESRGAEVFDKVVDSVEFLEPQESAGACPISTDATYGYTMENAIKVGGGAFDGPPRERAYLDTLLGPEGEEISYERLGSIGHEDVILDIYQVTYPGLDEAVSLYIDEYNFDELYAPAGFTCSGPFTLKAP